MIKLIAEVSEFVMVLYMMFRESSWLLWAILNLLEKIPLGRLLWYSKKTRIVDRSFSSWLMKMLFGLNFLSIVMEKSCWRSGFVRFIGGLMMKVVMMPGER